jgi:glutaredoxin 3
MAKLKVYTKSYCPYCVRVQSVLASADIEDYEEISIDGQEMAMRQKLVELTGGRWDVPQAFIDDRYIGDDDDLARLAQSGELKRMLEP